MSNFDLTIKPAQIEITAQPGVSFTQAYNVTNNSDSSLILNTSVLPWQPLGTNGSLTYNQVAPNSFFSFSLGNADLQLGQNFVLPPQSSRQLVLKIKSLPNTPLGDSYFTFFVSQDLSNSLHSEDNLSAATARIGSHFLISTSNSEATPVQASVSDFKLSPKIKDILFPQLHFEGKINNLSSYYFKTSGKITITKNHLVFRELDLFPQNVLADSSRNITCNYDNQNPSTCILSPPFWPGKYTATLTLNSPSSSPSATINFYVFPYTLVIIILLFIFLFFLIHSFSKRSKTIPSNS